ncbi:hypothetical protein, partial [Serratia fonticola]|uniref:hypothetical protein n=1 Tax=Serratia fonticola TaxID=47917 RepID=UPI0021BD842E
PSEKAKSSVVGKYRDRDLRSLKTTNPIKIMGFVISLKPAFRLVFYSQRKPRKIRALCRSVAALWTALIKILFYQCNILLTLPLLEGLRSFSIKRT